MSNDEAPKPKRKPGRPSVPLIDAVTGELVCELWLQRQPHGYIAARASAYSGKDITRQCVSDYIGRILRPIARQTTAGQIGEHVAELRMFKAWCWRQLNDIVEGRVYERYTEFEPVTEGEKVKLPPEFPSSPLALPPIVIDDGIVKKAAKRGKAAEMKVVRRMLKLVTLNGEGFLGIIKWCIDAELRIAGTYEAAKNGGGATGDDRVAGRLPHEVNATMLTDLITKLKEQRAERLALKQAYEASEN